MKSVKPGRGPSFMSAVVGIFVAVFGVAWTIMAVSAGAGFMGIFGLIFVAIAIIQVIYNFKNATGKNRYSEFDITEDDEEVDPWNQRFGERKDEREEFDNRNRGNFCPYCGVKIESDFSFCQKCGKKLPK